MSSLPLSLSLLLLMFMQSSLLLRRALYITPPRSSLRYRHASSSSLWLSGGATASKIPSEGASVTEELLVCPTSFLNSNVVRLLKSKRPQLQLVPFPASPSSSSSSTDKLLWSLHSSGGGGGGGGGEATKYQLDCTELEPMYLGKKQLDDETTAQKWQEALASRHEALFPHLHINDNDNDKEDKESLDVAVAAVHRACFLSRSLQTSLLARTSSVSKQDKSPVTVADFVVQALVIDALHTAFPLDKFIAEEDSDLLQEDPALLAKVLEALGAGWDALRLFHVIDLGRYNGTDAPEQHSRVWVLDPVDGTKGFMRGEHFCVALALLVKGTPTLSVLGCPNLNLQRVLHLQAPISQLCTPLIVNVDTTTTTVTVFPPSSGSLYFAVTGQGAFARSLAMPLGGAFEVRVSDTDVPAEATLCESTEASHGDRDITIHVYEQMRLTKDYLRLDGQCKYCVVGAGAAEGNLRLPAAGYREKIWDQAPGAHFVTEAGGTITDLEGAPLDFSLGRLLPPHVTGIIASNDALHKELLARVAQAKASLAERPKKTFGQP